MPEARYRIESEKHYPIMEILDPEGADTFQDCQLIVAYLEKKLDDSAFNLGLRIVPVEVTECHEL